MSERERASLDDGQQEMVQHQSSTSGVARKPPQRASTSEEEDNEQEEDRASQEYLIPVLMNPSSQSAVPSATTRSNKSGIPHTTAGDHHSNGDDHDDDESRLFMSEPSLSEDGDSVSRARAPHQADLLGTGPVLAGEQHDASNVQRRGTFQSSSEEEMIHTDYNDTLRGRSSGETPSGTDPEQQQQNQHDRRAHTPDQGRRRSRHRQSYTPTLSPGNTSLSSWDASPAIQQKVLLQFVMPENKYEKQARLQRQKQQQQRPQQQSPEQARVRLDMNTATGPSIQVVGARQRNQTGNSYHLDRGSSETGSFPEQTPGLNNDDDDAGKNREEDGKQANGGSRLPASDRMSADNFLRNLRVHSHGAVEEQDDLHTPLSMDDSFRQHQHGADQTEVDAVMRSHKDPRIFGSQNGNGNMKGLDSRHDDYDSVRGDVFSLPTTILGVARDSQEDSMAMTLSESEAGDTTIGGDGYQQHPHRRFEWDAQNSADDEKTAKRPLRIRKSTPGHRRTRSGDDAAAKIATGGNDWKGMEQDKIPFPFHEMDEDEEQPVTSEDLTNRRAQRYARAPKTGRVDTHAKEETASGGIQGTATASPSGPSTAAGLPPMLAAAGRGRGIQGRGGRSGRGAGRYQQNRMYWSPVPVGAGNKKDAGDNSQDNRRMWLNQGHSIHSSSSLHDSSYGSLHSLEETPEEYSEEASSSAGSTRSESSDNLIRAHQNRVSLTASFSDASQLEHMYQDGLRGTVPAALRRRTSHSPFANIGKKSAEKASRANFLPTSFVDDPGYPTYICPRCNTRQREFFTVQNAAGKFGGPGGYLALYFFVYVICSLFIFGLEEGWMPLDCIYFAVITLTTAGLGDFVPTSDANKITCSVFIYFGVACIGLLLGSYIAGMMDDRAIQERKENQIDACPNCARIRSLKESAERNAGRTSYSPLPTVTNMPKLQKFASERFVKCEPSLAAAVYSPNHHNPLFQSSHSSHSGGSHKSHLSHSPQGLPTLNEKTTVAGAAQEVEGLGLGTHPVSSVPSASMTLGSPVTRNILKRQSHTRHVSLDIGDDMNLFVGGMPTTYGTAERRVRTFREDLPAPSTDPVSRTSGNLRRIQSGTSLNDALSDYTDDNYDGNDDDESSVYSTSSSQESSSSVDDVWDTTKSKLAVAKYIFLTLRLALFNSMVIIAVGCVGFWLIEGFTLIDGWYFTTVLLTTVGYGDIVPITKGGKLFATIYVLVAGTILLNNMSTISMIPLELRKRRIERAILTQFGDHLDDAALRELATGPVITRLRLSANRADGLDECTREMFSLAMLVRLGKVTEHDIRETFAAFRHLDVNNDGVLNSKSIIAGMIAKQRRNNGNGPPPQSVPPPTTPTMPPPPPPPPPPSDAAAVGYRLPQRRSSGSF